MIGPCYTPLSLALHVCTAGASALVTPETGVLLPMWNVGLKGGWISPCEMEVTFSWQKVNRARVQAVAGT